jgi:hypothetical protein
MHRLTRKHVPLGGRQLKNPKGSEQIENNEPVERRKKQPEESGNFWLWKAPSFAPAEVCCEGVAVCVAEEEEAADVQRRSSLSLSLAYVLIAFPSLKRRRTSHGSG